jgi:hypothetical protein
MVFAGFGRSEAIPSLPALEHFIFLTYLICPVSRLVEIAYIFLHCGGEGYGRRCAAKDKQLLLVSGGVTR